MFSSFHVHCRIAAAVVAGYSHIHCMHFHIVDVKNDTNGVINVHYYPKQAKMGKSLHN